MVGRAILATWGVRFRRWVVATEAKGILPPIPGVGRLSGYPSRDHAEDVPAV